ncbi:MAG: orotate phosphoribosyltransferase [Clostridia bacterium]|nr:orotate phosphoribosyltransferase [Clostridia bacterium]
MSNVLSYLFETNAIKVCNENNPFWYTSGKIGPYYINTHYIYGSEKEATELLSFIDESLSNKDSLPKKVFDRVLAQYEQNEIYKTVVNTMKQYIEENVDLSEVDYVSGGERRDWFFSNILAYLLNKPHITIYKDLTTYVSTSDFSNTEEITELENKKILHVVDLINTSSSYIKSWIPAINKLGSTICWSCAAVDRAQGGKEVLANENIKTISIVDVDSSTFKKAFELNFINEKQLEMIEQYIKSPDDTMKNFLINHPDFLNNALNSDEKTKKRAKLLIDGNLYNLN